MRFVRVAAAHVFAVAVALAACAASPAALAPTATAEKGKTAFIKNGCWQCHDFAGEGSIATSNGRVIARTALPLDAFKTFVRTTNGPMPPFRPEILSDATSTTFTPICNRCRSRSGQRYSAPERRTLAVAIWSAQGRFG